MSKELEALKRLKETIISSSRSNWETEYYYVSGVESIKKDFALIEQALKRNEPMKVIFTKFNIWHDSICPKCKSPVVEEEKFCAECGQALDWSSSNE